MIFSRHIRLVSHSLSSSSSFSDFVCARVCVCSTESRKILSCLILWASVTTISRRCASVAGRNVSCAAPIAPMMMMTAKPNSKIWFFDVKHLTNDRNPSIFTVSHTLTRVRHAIASVYLVSKWVFQMATTMWHICLVPKIRCLFAQQPLSASSSPPPLLDAKNKTKVMPHTHRHIHTHAKGTTQQFGNYVQNVAACQCLRKPLKYYIWLFRKHRVLCEHLRHRHSDFRRCYSRASTWTRLHPEPSPFQVSATSHKMQDDGGKEQPAAAMKRNTDIWNIMLIF